MKKCLSMAMVLIAASVAQYSCRPAAYEVIKQKKNKDGNERGGPQAIAPDQKDPNEGAPAPIDGNVPPTAGLEVMWNGKSVTIVRVNSPVTVKPTWDTIDPDDIGRSQCTNPGIIRAAYNLDANAAPVAERVNGCEALSVPHVFTRTGEFALTLVVTSNENETAYASMTIVVVGESAPITGDGGIKVVADNMLPATGQKVTFTATCDLRKKHTVTWTFGDGNTAQGNVVTHAYRSEGQFRVDATCTDIDGKTVKAGLTLVVIGKQVAVPGKPPVNPNVPVDPVPGDSGQPGQIPGQQPGQRPGQQ